MAAHVELARVVALGLGGPVAVREHPVRLPPGVPVRRRDQDRVIAEQAIEVRRIGEPMQPNLQVVVERDREPVLHGGAEVVAELVQVLLDPRATEPDQLLGRDGGEPVVPRLGPGEVERREQRRRRDLIDREAELALDRREPRRGRVPPRPRAAGRRLVFGAQRGRAWASRRRAATPAPPSGRRAPGHASRARAASRPRCPARAAPSWRSIHDGIGRRPTSPFVGLRPARPQNAAGVRIDPPPSRRWRSGRAGGEGRARRRTRPGDHSRPQGLRAGPNSSLSVYPGMRTRAGWSGRSGSRPPPPCVRRDLAPIGGRTIEHRSRGEVGDPAGDVGVVLDQQRQPGERALGAAVVAPSRPRQSLLGPDLVTAFRSGFRRSIRASAVRRARTRTPAFADVLRELGEHQRARFLSRPTNSPRLWSRRITDAALRPATPITPPPGMGPGTAQVHPGDRRPIVAVARDRPEAEHLIRRELALHDVAAEQAEPLLDVRRREHLDVLDRALEAGRELAERLQHPRRVLVAAPVVPRALAQLVRPVLAEREHQVLALGRRALGLVRGGEHHLHVGVLAHPAVLRVVPRRSRYSIEGETAARPRWVRPPDPTRGTPGARRARRSPSPSPSASGSAARRGRRRRAGAPHRRATGTW